MLAPLAMNGGPTLTMALLPGSPAIDAGDTSLAPRLINAGSRGPPARPRTSAPSNTAPADLAVSPAARGGIDILGFGITGQACRLLSSPDLSSWVPIATNQIGTNGTVLFYDTCAPGGACRFYRLVMP